MSLSRPYDESASPVIIEALTRQLKELYEAIGLLSDEQFQTSFVYKTDSNKIKASVGQHTRHIIEFVDTLLNNVDERLINYDERNRDKDIENSVATAKMTITRLCERLKTLTNQDLQKPIDMVEAVHVESDSDPAGSTVAREIYFVISHTEHHFALIAERCDILGISLPDNFGKAVSTRRYESGASP